VSGAAGFRGPVFLVGMPRSGTKLLRGLLNEHSRIGIPLNETEFLPHWVRTWSSFGDLSDPEAFRRFWRRVAGSSYFVNRAEEHGCRTEPEIWRQACAAYDVASVFEALVRLDAGVPRDGDGVWGDKSPTYLVHMPLLKDLFPAARFVHVVRDVRDHCLSLRDAFGKDMLRAAQRWVDRVEAGRTAGARFPEAYLEVRYEDLLDSTAPVLRGACAFLELPYEPSMLRLSRAPEDLGRARGSTRIVRDSRERYRAELDRRARLRIEAIACRTLERLGYPVEHRGPPRRLSPATLWLRRVGDGLRLIARDVPRRGWLGSARTHLRACRETLGRPLRRPAGPAA
jgi:hypothetical protein